MQSLNTNKNLEIRPQKLVTCTNSVLSCKFHFDVCFFSRAEPDDDDDRDLIIGLSVGAGILALIIGFIIAYAVYAAR